MHSAHLRRNLLDLHFLAVRAEHGSRRFLSMLCAAWSPRIIGLAALTAACAIALSSRAPSEVQVLSDLAAGGDSGAQLELGLAYRDGRLGLTPDRELSRHWLQAAADEGNAYAATALQSSAPAAVQSSRKGADVGNAAATDEGMLGQLATEFHSYALESLSYIADFLSRTSLTTHSVTALRTAAEAGNPVAEYQLGIRYRDGAAGLQRDPAAARHWLSQAAGAGNTLADQALAGLTR